MRHPIVLGLLMLSLALMGIVVREISGFAAPAALPPATEHRTTFGAAAPAAARDEERTQAMVDTILARPLFAPSRRPPVTAASGQPDATGLPRLAGIIVGPAGHAAIFANSKGGRPLVMAEGDRLDGFLIQAIAADQVVVLGRDGSRILRPSFVRAATTTTAMAPGEPTVGALVNDARMIALPGLHGRPPGLATNPTPSATPVEAQARGFPSIAAPEPGDNN